MYSPKIMFYVLFPVTKYNPEDSPKKEKHNPEGFKIDNLLQGDFLFLFA